MPNIFDQYRNEFLRNQQLYQRRIKLLIMQVAKEISDLKNDPQAKYINSYDFSSQKKLSKKIDNIFVNFESNYSQLLQDSSAEMWNLANQKNDKLVDQFLSGIALIEGIDKKLSIINKQYYQRNIDALNAFFESEKSFSDSIYKVGSQLRREMEIHLAYGIINGDSSDTISRRIRYYLKDPQKLFRRVRDKKGNLVLSKNAKEFHPGTGKYRSSYKNAVRLTRTTTNMSYLTADYERWQQLDFVIGIKIKVSAGHYDRMPKGDICDELQGIYPKWFKFVGWHAQCLCTAVAITISIDDFKRQLLGENIDIHYVQDVPVQFTSWVSTNTERITRWKNTPYFIRDNFKYGNIAHGLNH